MDGPGDRVPERWHESRNTVSHGIYNTKIPDGLAEKIGRPPPVMIQTVNPAHEKWRERCAMYLCKEAGELGEIPTPCARHLRDASNIASQMLMRVTN